LSDNTNTDRLREKTMKRNLFKSLLLIGSAFAITACSDDVYVDGEEVLPGRESDEICFMVSDKYASRGGSDDGSHRVGGAFFYNADKTDSIYVSLTVAEQGNGAASRAGGITEEGYNPLCMTCLKCTAEGKSYYFSNIKFSKDASGRWVSDPPYRWLDEYTHFNFYGYAPADANGVTYINDEQTWQPKLDYRVPTDVTLQSDIIYNSTTQEFIANENRAIAISMKHALANIAFRCGNGMAAGTIDKVTIKNVSGHGTLNLTDGRWTLDPASATDFSATIGKVSADNLDITTDTDMTYFMLMPGCNSEATTVGIEFTKSTGETETYTAPLTTTWEAGKQYMYTVTIDPDFNIIVDPKPQDAHYVICKATVAVANLQPGQQWEMKATASDGAKVTLLHQLDKFQQQGFWIDRVLFQANNSTASIDKGSARGEPTLEGAGSGDVYIFLPENVSRTDDRTITLSMNVKGSDNIVTEQTIRQVCPAWTDGGFGWEQFENDPTATWGFLWNRTVTYRKKDIWLNLLIYGPMVNDLVTKHNAGGYAKVTNYGFGDRTKIVIDYTKLNNLGDISIVNDNGLPNTRELYNKAGSATTGSLEQAMNDLVSRGVFSMTSDVGTLDDITSAAMGYILLKNKYDLLQIEKRDGNDVGITESPVLAQEGIMWYLPAIDEFGYPPTVGDQLNGTYWSSNPDPNNNANALTNNGSFGRMSQGIQVRACRR